MTELIIPSEGPAPEDLKERKLDQIARKTVLSLLNKLQHGRITITENYNRFSFGEESPTAFCRPISVFIIRNFIAAFYLAAALVLLKLIWKDCGRRMT